MKLGPLIFVITICLYAADVIAQVDTAWVRRYDSLDNWPDEGIDIAVDNQFNVYVVGSSKSRSTWEDYLTIKYLPNGDTAWTRRYNGVADSSDWPHKICLDTLGNIYVTGSSKLPGGALEIVTIKYDPAGNTVWLRRSSGPFGLSVGAHDMAVDREGNVCITGSTAVEGSIHTDYLTIKYNSNGDTAWTRTYNGLAGYGDESKVVAIDAQGNVIVSGQSYGYRTDILTIKYNANGDTLWTNRNEGPWQSGGSPEAIALDDEGNFYISGFFYNGDSPDFIMMEYSPEGELLLSRSYDGPGNDGDQALGIALNNFGEIYVTGPSGGAGTFCDYATVKYLANGDTAWVRRYNGPGNADDWSSDIVTDAQGNAYVTGYSEGANSVTDYATIKYSADGEMLWEERYDDPDHGIDDANAICIDKVGSVYVTGRSVGDGTATDMATIKYIQNSNYCPYTLGDINESGAADAIDVTFGVNYLKGRARPNNPCDMCPESRPFYASGDVNGSCEFNAIDITFFVNYLKGRESSLIVCPDCPPVNHGQYCIDQRSKIGIMK